jgi:hypothetical protein
LGAGAEESKPTFFYCEMLAGDGDAGWMFLVYESEVLGLRRHDVIDNALRNMFIN